MVFSLAAVGAEKVSAALTVILAGNSWSPMVSLIKAISPSVSESSKVKVAGKNGTLPLKRVLAKNTANATKIKMKISTIILLLRLLLCLTDE